MHATDIEQVTRYIKGLTAPDALASFCQKAHWNWYHATFTKTTPTPQYVIDNFTSRKTDDPIAWKRICHVAGVTPQLPRPNIPPGHKKLWLKHVPTILERWEYGGDRKYKRDPKRRPRYVEQPPATVWSRYTDEGHHPNPDDFELFLDWHPYFREFDVRGDKKLSYYTLTWRGRWRKRSNKARASLSRHLRALDTQLGKAMSKTLRYCMKYIVPLVLTALLTLLITAFNPELVAWIRNLLTNGSGN